MLTEKAFVMLGFAMYTVGILLAGLSIHRFREYRRTNEEGFLFGGIVELALGFLLAILARIPWDYTRIGAFFPH